MNPTLQERREAYSKAVIRVDPSRILRGHLLKAHEHAREFGDAGTFEYYKEYFEKLKELQEQRMVP